MTHTPEPLALRDALAPYVSIPELRRLAAERGADLRAALLDADPPPSVLALLDALAAVLNPAPREQITQPAEVAALLMVEMGYLPQEEFRVVCLDTKNRVQTIYPLYQGNVSGMPVRVAEIFREPLRRTSASMIVVHNHPSGDCEPSPEDVWTTREIIAAGRLLNIQVLDHLIIGRGCWTSIRVLHPLAGW